MKPNHLCSLVRAGLKPHLQWVLKSSFFSPRLKNPHRPWGVCSLSAWVPFMFLLCWRSSKLSRITVSLSEDSCWIWRIPVRTGFGCLRRRFWILLEDLTSLPHPSSSRGVWPWHTEGPNLPEPMFNMSTNSTIDHCNTPNLSTYQIFSWVMAVEFILGLPLNLSVLYVFIFRYEEVPRLLIESETGTYCWGS